MCATSLDINQLNVEFESAAPVDILAWSWEYFQPGIVASSSFQTQSVALLHMIAQVCPELPVLFLDTGYHFPETLAFRDELRDRFKLNIRIIYPDSESKQYLENPMEALYLRDPDLCCRFNKVEPLAQALTGMAAWISGVRHDQTGRREKLRVFESRDDGLIKIHPLLNWTKRDLWLYIDRYDLPTHPLFSQGYMSIGCAPCTRPVYDGEDERSGRWAGSNKVECGLHTMHLPLLTDADLPLSNK